MARSTAAAGRPWPVTVKCSLILVNTWAQPRRARPESPPCSRAPHGGRASRSAPRRTRCSRPCPPAAAPWAARPGFGHHWWGCASSGAPSIFTIWPLPVSATKPMWERVPLAPVQLTVHFMQFPCELNLRGGLLQCSKNLHTIPISPDFIAPVVSSTLQRWIPTLGLTA